MKLHLYGFPLCPFAQAVAVLLEERQVPYEYRPLDRRAKPDWFRTASPLGTVPLVVFPDARSLFETAAILEYLDVRYPEASTAAADPWRKAQGMAWSAVLSSLNFDLSARRRAADVSARATASMHIADKLDRLEAALVGPFFLGERFSVVDALAAPPLARVGWIEASWRDSFPSRWPRLDRWREALLRRDSVRRALGDEARNGYLTYAEAGGVR